MGDAVHVSRNLLIAFESTGATHCTVVGFKPVTCGAPVIGSKSKSPSAVNS